MCVYVSVYIYIWCKDGQVCVSFDLAISNCVVNLSPDKDAMIKEVYRYVCVYIHIYVVCIM
jgi:hypothetical protein